MPPHAPPSTNLLTSSNTLLAGLSSGQYASCGSGVHAHRPTPAPHLGPMLQPVDRINLSGSQIVDATDAGEDSGLCPLLGIWEVSVQFREEGRKHHSVFEAWCTAVPQASRSCSSAAMYWDQPSSMNLRTTRRWIASPCWECYLHIPQPPAQLSNHRVVN